MPTISVIVPVYRVEPYLRRCVDSILNQTFSDFELILVDDGSPDNCGAICDEYAERDTRVRVIHQENGGLSAARNAGIDWAISNSDSQWISFIDSDDWICRTYFQRLHESAEKYCVDISCSNYVMLTTESFPAEEFTQAVVLSVEDFWKKYPSPSVVAWGKLYKKVLFTDVRYPVGRIWEDAFTTHKVLFCCDNVAWIPETLYCYRDNQYSITHNVNLAQRILQGEAYEVQAVFFHERNLVGIRNTAIRRMLHHTHAALEQAEKEGDMDKIKTIKNDISRRIEWAQKELKISLYGNESIYECVMPFRAAASRKWRHFKMNLRKLFKL